MPLICEKQVCLDLLKAKLDVMDHGRGFPFGQAVVCGRCRSVVAELDLAERTCAQLDEVEMPARVRTESLEAIRRSESAGGGVAPGPKRTRTAAKTTKRGAGQPAMGGSSRARMAIRAA